MNRILLVIVIACLAPMFLPIVAGAVIWAVSAHPWVCFGTLLACGLSDFLRPSTPN
jgi:hypothetical protein